jgi:hypothetical protein
MIIFLLGVIIWALVTFRSNIKSAYLKLLEKISTSRSSDSKIIRTETSLNKDQKESTSLLNKENDEFNKNESVASIEPSNENISTKENQSVKVSNENLKQIILSNFLL